MYTYIKLCAKMQNKCKQCQANYGNYLMLTAKKIHALRVGN